MRCDKHGCPIDRAGTEPQAFGGHPLMALAHEKIGSGDVENKKEAIEESLTKIN